MFVPLPSCLHHCPVDNTHYNSLTVALGAFQCGGSKSRSVDSVVEARALAYLLYGLERGSTVYTCVCEGRGRAQ